LCERNVVPNDVPCHNNVTLLRRLCDEQSTEPRPKPRLEAKTGARTSALLRYLYLVPDDVPSCAAYAARAPGTLTFTLTWTGVSSDAATRHVRSASSAAALASASQPPSVSRSTSRSTETKP
jgi:hypothetical protein